MISRGMSILWLRYGTVNFSQAGIDDAIRELVSKWRDLTFEAGDTQTANNFVIR